MKGAQLDILVWADFHCPYCYIGKARMKKALKEAGFPEARLRLRTYLLNPEASEREGESLNEYSISQYGAKPEKVYAQNARLEAEGRELGLVLDLKGARYANMTDAHRLFHYAKTLGRGEAFFDLAQQALFTKGALLSDRETLLSLAERAGIPGRGRAVGGSLQGGGRRGLQGGSGPGHRLHPLFRLRERGAPLRRPDLRGVPLRNQETPGRGAA